MSTKKYLIYLVCFSLAIISVFGIVKLKFEYDLTKFYSDGQKDVEFYNSLKAEFHESNELVLVGIKANQAILSKEFIPKLDTITMLIQSIPEVESVSSLTTIRNYLKTPMGLFSYPFIHKNDLRQLPLDSNTIFQYNDIRPKFISNDGKSTCLYISLKMNRNIDPIKLDSILNLYDLKDTYVLGGGIAERDYEEYLKEDVRFLSLVSGIVIFTFLLVIYRSFKIILSAVLIIGLTLLYTISIMGFLNIPLNMITGMIPCVVSILCLSDIIHIVSRFQEDKVDNKKSTSEIIRTVRPSIFLTSLTTLIGFFSLVISTVAPFIQFGVIVSLGIVIAYLLSVYLLPLLLHFVNFKKDKNHTKTQSSRLEHGFYQKVIKSRKAVLAVFAALTICSVVSTSKVNQNSYLYDNINSGDELSASLNFFESNFFGIRNDEIIVTPVDGVVLSKNVVIEIDKLEKYLSNQFGAKDVYSLNTELKRYNRVIEGGNPEGFEIIPEARELNSLITQFSKVSKSKMIHQGLVSRNATMTKIWIKSKDWGSSVEMSKVEGFNDYVKENINPEVISVTFTGHSYLMDKANSQITSFLLISLGVAMVVVVIIVGFLYSSWKMVLISLLPNFIPLITTLGLMGLFDIGLNLSTIIVFTIAFGIGVDDTIHFLARFKIEKESQGVNNALRITWLSTGRAIVITSIILILGFSVLEFSNFQSTIRLGYLVSATLLIALLSDLILLPCLIRVFYISSK